MPSDSGQAGATTELVITPQMVEAGLRYLYTSGLVDHRVPADSVAVAEIYRAMAALQPKMEFDRQIYE